MIGAQRSAEQIAAPRSALLWDAMAVGHGCTGGTQTPCWTQLRLEQREIYMRRMALGLFFGLALSIAFIASASAQVYHWGLGTNTPTLVEKVNDPILIDAGNADGFAIESNGTVKAWGSDRDGDLGDGLAKSHKTGAAVTVDLPAGVKAVSLGEAERSGFAVTSTGEVYDWGDNQNGDLCQGGEESNLSTPEKIAGLTEVVAAQGAEHHVLFLLANGQVKVCGWNNQGQDGLGSAVSEARTPTLVPGVSHIVEMSASPKGSTLLNESGEVFVFGTNHGGQDGLGKGVKQADEPTHLRLPGRATQISNGGGTPESHTFALVEGVPYGWGSDEAGEIGDGSTESKYTPVIASELVTYGFTTLKAAGRSSCGIAAGDVYCWGENGSGELGTPSAGDASFSPVLADTDAVELSATAQNIVDRH
jgi:alpha-tubulin suppressor-like RCC1 family protein